MGCLVRVNMMVVWFLEMFFIDCFKCLYFVVKCKFNSEQLCIRFKVDYYLRKIKDNLIFFYLFMVMKKLQGCFIVWEFGVCNYVFGFELVFMQMFDFDCLNDEVFGFVMV